MKKSAERELADGLYKPSKRHYLATDFDGYCAAPLLLVGPGTNHQVVEGQAKLAWRMADAAYGEVVKVARPPVALFAAHSTLLRMHQREGMNAISYMHRRYEVTHPEEVPFADESAVFEACDVAKYGKGTPVQNDMARRAFGMASIELANLTIFNGFRGELEAPMWQAVGELMDGRDVTPKADEIYNLHILGFDRPISTAQHIGAVRIGMKRHIGRLDDGAEVKARTTATINTSPSSGFDETIVERFKDIERRHRGKGDEYVRERMALVPEFQRAVAWLVSTELPAGLVLTRNETVYACKG